MTDAAPPYRSSERGSQPVPQGQHVGAPAAVDLTDVAEVQPRAADDVAMSACLRLAMPLRWF
jgi:hypothetical protein